MVCPVAPPGHHSQGKSGPPHCRAVFGRRVSHRRRAGERYQRTCGELLSRSRPSLREMPVVSPDLPGPRPATASLGWALFNRLLGHSIPKSRLFALWQICRECEELPPVERATRIFPASSSSCSFFGPGAAVPFRSAPGAEPACRRNRLPGDTLRRVPDRTRSPDGGR